MSRKHRTWLHIGSKDAPFILVNVFKSKGFLIEEVMARRLSLRQWRIAQGYEDEPKPEKQQGVLDVTDMLRPTMGDYWRPPNRILHFEHGPIELSIKRGDLDGINGAWESLTTLLQDIKAGQREFKHTPLYVRAMDPIGTTVWLTKASHYKVLQYADGLDCSLCSEEARTFEARVPETGEVKKYVKVKGDCICEEGLITLYLAIFEASIVE